ncbi:MAG: phosphoribosylamine--glycine ligase [Clostridiaceae bacterium]|nr:phosphoribosylamine--glycine ligase [Clostridiaceae bacterium]
MKVLIIGSGGREHAIADSLIKNDRIETVYFLTHNGAAKGKLKNANFPDNSKNSIDQFLLKYPVELVIVGPEQPLSEGIVDYIQEKGIKVFGPHKKAARLEASKAFAKRFMEEQNIPTAKYIEYDNYESALNGLDNFEFPLVIKADGLCAGKGVVICQNYSEAKKALADMFKEKIFGDQAQTVIIEEFLSGFEASLLCFVSGSKIYPLDTAMDYKKIYENDLGPNTGGVGMISPNPYWNSNLQSQSDIIIKKIENGLSQRGLEYSGILFIGYLIEDGKIYVLEFNVRFGDPETEALLPRLHSDLLENIEESINRLPVNLKFDNKVALATLLVSKGYPASFEKGKVISGLEDCDPDIKIYHNGTKNIDDKILSNGGRVLSIVAVKDTLEEAREAVYQNIPKISFENMSYRTDIGQLKNYD